MTDRTGNTVDTVFNSAVRRVVFVVLAVTGAAVIGLALAACGQSLPPAAQGSGIPAAQGSTPAAQGSTSAARGSPSAVIRPASGSGTSTACPTQGVGGDSLPALCAPSSSLGGQVSITGPASESPPTSTSSAAPSVTGVSPSQGSEAGGDSVTVDGTGFCVDPRVSFGGAEAQATDESPTQIVAISPPEQAGQPTVDVTVLCDGSISPTVAADQFTYLPSTSPSPTAPAASP